MVIALALLRKKGLCEGILFFDVSRVLFETRKGKAEEFQCFSNGIVFDFWSV